MVEPIRQKFLNIDEMTEFIHKEEVAASSLSQQRELGKIALGEGYYTIKFENDIVNFAELETFHHVVKRVAGGGRNMDSLESAILYINDVSSGSVKKALKLNWKYWTEQEARMGLTLVTFNLGISNPIGMASWGIVPEGKEVVRG